MLLSEIDIDQLDIIIYALHENTFPDTIPEIINGYEHFDFDAQTKNKYLFYESFLIDNNFCSLKKGWTINSIPNGYKTLQLASKGNELVHFHKSVRNYYVSISDAEIIILKYLYSISLNGLIKHEDVLNSINLLKADYKDACISLANKKHVDNTYSHILLRVEGKSYFEEVLRKDLPRVNPISQPKPTPRSHTIIKIISSLWIIISTNLVWAAVIAGIIILVLSHFVFGSP